MNHTDNASVRTVLLSLLLVAGLLFPSAFLPLAVKAEETPTATPLATSLAGQLDTAWSIQDWPEVLRLLDLIEQQNPTFPELDDKRYFAYVNYGYQLMTQNLCTESLSAFRNALLIRPDGDEAQAGLELLARYCTTPMPGTATPTPPYPTNTPVPGATPVPGGTTPGAYTVVAGDTLYSLARSFGVTVQELMQANGLNSYLIKVGQELTVPSAESAPTEVRVHIVQPGETLFNIADQYGVTVSSIMSMNSLTSHAIWAYQALYIPPAELPDMILHTVATGETLYGIAQEYDITVAALMMANGLTDYGIYVYQRLVIPPEDWSGGNITPPSVAVTHFVASGDTLFSIARSYNTTVSALKSANGLGSSVIYAGTILRIP